MAIGGIFSAPVESLALGGEGIVHEGGRTVFVPFTAPGDMISCRIVRERKDWAEGELLDLEEASPLRTEPRCPYYGKCGGCSLQHIEYDAQIKAKQWILADTFIRLGGFAPPEITPVPSPPWEYRNRVSFHAVRANRGPKAGFKARGSDEIIPVTDCPVCDPLIRSLLGEEALIPPPQKDRFTVYGRSSPEGDLLLSEAAAVGRDLPCRGSLFLLEKQLHLDAGCFFQSNGALLETLIRTLRTAAENTAPKNLPMADLYAGAGTFSCYLADLFSGADLLEENPRSLELARQNLAAPAFRFFRDTDEAWARKRAPKTGAYAFVVADPPRQGLSRSMTDWLIAAGPPVAAYVSCEPSSLARDCRRLCHPPQGNGAYTLDRLWLFDFYPQTPHIESLALLLRQP